MSDTPILARVPDPRRYFAMLDIHIERSRQDEQWGGPAFDDMHNPMDWIDLIDVQLDKLAHEGGPGVEADPVTPDHDTELVRQRLVKVAALAIAGIQSIDRLQVPT